MNQSRDLRVKSVEFKDGSRILPSEIIPGNWYAYDPGGKYLPSDDYSSCEAAVKVIMANGYGPA